MKNGQLQEQPLFVVGGGGGGGGEDRRKKGTRRRQRKAVEGAHSPGQNSDGKKLSLSLNQLRIYPKEEMMIEGEAAWLLSDTKWEKERIVKCRLLGIELKEKHLPCLNKSVANAMNKFYGKIKSKSTQQDSWCELSKAASAFHLSPAQVCGQDPYLALVPSPKGELGCMLSQARRVMIYSAALELGLPKLALETVGGSPKTREALEAIISLRPNDTLNDTDLEHLLNVIHFEQASVLSKILFARSLTFCSNKESMIPLLLALNQERNWCTKDQRILPPPPPGYCIKTRQGQYNTQILKPSIQTNLARRLALDCGYNISKLAFAAVSRLELLSHQLQLIFEITFPRLAAFLGLGITSMDCHNLSVAFPPTWAMVPLSSLKLRMRDQIEIHLHEYINTLIPLIREYTQNHPKSPEYFKGLSLQNKVFCLTHTKTILSPVSEKAFNLIFPPGTRSQALIGDLVRSTAITAALVPYNPYKGRTVATKIIQDLILLSSEERTNLLITSLKKQDLELRSDSAFCTSFIKATTAASADEVTATMMITAFLFSNYSHRVWSENHDVLESELQSRVEIDDSFNGSWTALAADILDTATIAEADDHDEFDDEDEEDEMLDLEDDFYDSPQVYHSSIHGCWDCGGPDFPCSRCGRGY